MGSLKRQIGIMLTLAGLMAAFCVPAASESAGGKAERTLLLAEKGLISGDAETAARLFKSVTADEGAGQDLRVRAAWGLAQCLAAEGQWQEAADAIGNFVERGAKVPERAAWLAAECYCQSGTYTRAEKLFKLISEGGGLLALNASLRRALCLYYLGRRPEAEDTVARSMGMAASQDQKAKVFLVRAFLDYSGGRHEEALKSAKSALELAGAELKARSAVVAACAAIAAGKPEEVVRLLEPAAGAQSPAITEKAAFIGKLVPLATGEAKMSAEAEKSLRASREFSDKAQTGPLLVMLGDLYARSGEFEEAIRCWKEAGPALSEPAKAEAAKRMGFASWKLKQFNRAFAFFEEANDPKDIEALCQFLLGAGASQPGRFIASFRLALLRANAGLHAKAAEILTSGVEGLEAPGLKQTSELAKAYFHETAGNSEYAVAGYLELARNGGAEVARVARYRLLLLCARKNMYPVVVDFCEKLTDVQSKEMNEVELYIVGLSYLGGGGGSTAAQQEKAHAVFKRLVEMLGTKLAAGREEKALPEAVRMLFLPSLARFAALARGQDEFRWALERYEAVMRVEFAKRLASSDPQKAIFTVPELLVGAEIRRGCGQYAEAAELYQAALEKIAPSSALADPVRLQLAACMIDSGLGSKAVRILDEIKTEGLTARAGVAKVAALAAAGQYEKALEIASGLEPNLRDDGLRRELERLKSEIQSGSGKE